MGSFNSSQIATGDTLSFKDASGQSVTAQITDTDENAQQITATVVNPATPVQVDGLISVSLSTGDTLKGSISSPSSNTFIINVTGVTSSFDIDSSSGAKGGASAGGVLRAIQNSRRK
jgi:hypothetical protein